MKGAVLWGCAGVAAVASAAWWWGMLTVAYTLTAGDYGPGSVPPPAWHGLVKLAVAVVVAIGGHVIGGILWRRVERRFG